MKPNSVLCWDALNRTLVSVCILMTRGAARQVSRQPKIVTTVVAHFGVHSTFFRIKDA